VEKPLADNRDDGREILDRIRAKSLPMVVPHGLLVVEHGRQILEGVRQGWIGDLELVEIQITNWDILNAGIHFLDFFVELTENEPVEYVMACCDASTRTYRDGMQVETLAVTYVQTRSGIRVVMNTGDYVKIAQEGKGMLYRLVGTRGVLDFYGWESCYRLVNAAHPQGQLVEVDPGAQGGHQRHLSNLLAQMDGGEPDYAVAEGSLAALELCEAAYLSCAYHVPVRLPLADFSAPGQVDWEPGKPYDGAGGGRNGRRLPPLDPGDTQ
jgi:predicted dehydrogenase